MKKLFLATTAFVVLAAMRTCTRGRLTRHLRRPLRSTPGPACTGAPTSATAGANRKTTVPVALSASASTCRNLNTSTASSAASKPATTISLEHGCSGWKPTSRPPVTKAAFPVLALPPTALTNDHKLQWFGTTRPRLGFLATPNLLLYGTAGVAYGQTKDTFTVNTLGVGTAATASVNDVRAGWTAGGGIEGAFGGGWSAKVEYLYMDLGKLEQTITVPTAALAATFNSRLTDNIVRVGLNYKWGGGY